MRRTNDLTEIMNMVYSAKYTLQQKANSMNKPVQVVLHWTAGRYMQYFSDYHINIDFDGSYHLSTEDFSEIKYHNYQKNTGSIGIALCCAYNANTQFIGDYPPTSEQIEACAKVMAVISKALEVDLDVVHFPTHGESADNLDYEFYYSDNNGYPNNIYGPNYMKDGILHQGPCERWDLQYFGNNDSPTFLPCGMAGTGGEVLRRKAKAYRMSFYGD